MESGLIGCRGTFLNIKMAEDKGSENTLSIDEVLRSTTASGATRATTTSASAQWIGGSYTESGSWAGIDKFNTDGATRFQEAFFYKKLHAVTLKNFIVVFWLIKSQSKRWAGTAALHKGNPESGINVALLHIFLQFCYSQISYGKIRHRLLLLL